MKSKIEQLEGLRGAAAAYVAVSHLLVRAFDPKGGISVLLRFGQTAVIAFFLISGFVIYYSTHAHRDQSFRGYFRRRALRIYPIFLLALLVSYLAGALPGHAVFRWRDLAGNLLMLQDFSLGKPGVWADVFCGNAPLWSLSYEWWFYMMFFPLYRYVSAGSQLLAAAGISLTGLLTYAAHPNQLSLFLLYFILWWSGLELARTFRQGIRPTFYTQRLSILILGGFCFLVPLVLIGGMPRSRPTSPGFHPLLEVSHFGSAFVLLCAGLLWSRLRWKGFAAVFGVFVWIAPISYAVYVLHYPLGMYFFDAAWIPGAWLRLLAVVVCTLVLACFAEMPWQQAFNRWTRRGPLRPAADPGPA